MDDEPRGGPPNDERDVSEDETLARDNVDLEDLPTAALPASTRRPPARVGRSLALEAGQTFGPYRLVRLLGRGGFGQVWEAESLHTGRRLALKILTAAPTASSDEIERFRREGRLAASLSHPHCVYVFSAEEIQGFPVITMELMPGGTLQDRINDVGPLPYREAVDYILQIAEGLEAADRIGVIHRDVKPSNCFLDVTGAARVGDFGLSRALDVDTRLTVTGSFLGTPSYSSPEQVKGRDVDARSDLYSLGATLYALLAGKPPFSGGGGTQVLARILSEPPDPFSDHGVEVPRGLRQVVLRLLAKDKARRYPSYSALRSALLPYSSQGLATGHLGRRAVAILADFFLFNLAATLVAGTQILFRLTLWNEGLRGLLLLTYFAVLEGLWGQSLGKRLLGLRVVTGGGGPAPLSSVALRSTIFVSVLFLPPTLLIAVLSGPSFQALGVQYPLPFLAFNLLLPIGLLLSTMRKRNGYAALHDLATRTRVMAVQPVTPRLTADGAADEARRGVESPRTFGPYRELHPLWETKSEGLLVARDDELHRDVWVHCYRDASRVPSTDQLVASRRGRLHWLQGSHEAAEMWDVYEAPTGTSLVERVRSTGPLSWADVRQGLLDLAGELSSRSEGSSPPGSLSLSQVWISGDGSAKLLDFSATGDDGGEDAPGATADWRTFLHRLLLFSLEGRRLTPAELGSRAPRVPLPEHARPLVQRLCGLTPPPAAPAKLSEELAALAHRTAAVTRTMRLGPFALSAVLPAFLGLSTTMMVLGSGDGVTANRLLVQGSLAEHKLETLPNEAERQAARRAIRTAQAHAFATLQSVAADESQGLQRNVAIGFLTAQSPSSREELESALSEYPNPTAEELAAARRRLDALAPPYRLASLLPRIALVVLSLFAIPALLLALVARGAPLLALFGIAVQTVEGGRASRLRCLLRSLLIWGPFVLYHFWQPWPILIVVFPLTVATGMAFALARPASGLPDWLVGTRLVPR